MGRISTGLRLRGRRKPLKSGQALVSWARKQKQLSISTQCSAGPKTPLHCPLTGCSGHGHINGVSDSHLTLSACPLFHNLNLEKWSEMRTREDGIVSPGRLGGQQQNTPIKQKCHLVDRHHQFRTSLKEPPLDNLATSMEVYKFRCAQQRLVIDPQREAREHLLICTRIAANQGDSEQQQHRQLHGLATGDVVNSDHQPASFLDQRIHTVVFGSWEIHPTENSAYPPDVACLPTIYVCEYCLTPIRHSVAYERHVSVCSWAFPPGDEIYRKEKLSFFEVDGNKHADYCSNLCLLTKLFLKHKTVHETDQVTGFHFYVLTETDAEGSHFMGFFSKQKLDEQGVTSVGTGSAHTGTSGGCSTTKSGGSGPSVYHNLSCILILPHYQCLGYGRMLIELSYALSRLENRVGSPERPLSDLGLIMYRKYWQWEILIYMMEFSDKTINIRNMSEELGIAIADIVSTLLHMKMLVYFRTQYYIVNNKCEVQRLLSGMRRPDPSRRIDKSCLVWTPHSICPATRTAGRSTVSVKSTMSTLNTETTPSSMT